MGSTAFSHFFLFSQETEFTSTKEANDEKLSQERRSSRFYVPSNNPQYNKEVDLKSPIC
jgi:hypothetical protein